MEIVYFQQANAENIYSALIEHLKKGWDLTEQPHSWVRFGVYTQMKNFTSHALFVHCHCHILQLVCVQAVNSMPRISTLQREQSLLKRFSLFLIFLN